MPEPLDAELDLSIVSALSAVNDLQSAIEDAFTSATASFDDDFSKVVDALPPVAIEADASAITPEIDAAISDADTQLNLFADLTEADQQLTLFSNEAAATEAIVTVTADTSDAEAALEDVASAADDATASFGQGAQSSVKLAEGANLIAGASSLARGEVGGLKEAAGALGAVSVGTVVGVGALAATAGHLFEKGVEANSAIERFNRLVGDMAEKVRTVQVGDLNIDLDKLAIKLGTSVSGLTQAEASVFQFAINAGASREKAAEFASELTALAARGVALKPSLGGVDAATESLSVRLARGGRFAQNYGISLTAAEINARALTETQKASVGELTIYEKAQAAADISVEKYGNTLKTTVSEGAKNATIEQRSLHEQLIVIEEDIGKPLVSPLFALIKEAHPVVKDLGGALGELAIDVIPAIVLGLHLLVPPLKIAGDIFHELPAPIVAIGGVGIITAGVVTHLAEAHTAAAIAAAAQAKAEEEAAAATALEGAAAGEAAASTGIFAGVQAALGADVALAIPTLGQAAIGVGVFGAAYIGTTTLLHAFLDETDKLGPKLDTLSKNESKLATVNNSEIVPAFEKLKREYLATHTNATAYIADTAVISDLYKKSPALAQSVVDSLRAQGTATGAMDQLLLNLARTQTYVDTTTGALKSSTEDLTTKYNNEVKALDGVNDALIASYDKQFAAIHADEQAYDAIQNVNTAYDDAIKSGKSVAEATGAYERALTAADEQLLHSAVAQGEYARAQYTGTDATAGANIKIDAQRAYLEKERDVVGADTPLGRKLQEYIDSLHDIPPAVVTPISAPGVDETTTKIQGLTKSIYDLQVAANQILGGALDATPSPPAQTRPSEEPIPAAVGRYVPARAGGTLVRVGEAGAAEVVLPTDDDARARSLLRQAGLEHLIASTTHAPSGHIDDDKKSYQHHDHSIHAPITIIEATEPFATATKVVRRFSSLQYLAGG